MTFTRERLVTTKKPHRCFGCWRKFPSGTKMTYVAGVNQDGDFCTNYECATCTKIIKEMKWEDVSELSPGDLYDIAIKEEANVAAATPSVPVPVPSDGVPDGDARV